MTRKPIQTLVKCAALTLAFVAGVACGDLEAALDGAECFDHSDCGTLGCVIPNPNGLNLTGLGWCAETPVCVAGEQPFCTCVIDPATSMPSCTGSGDYNRLVPSTTPCWDGVDINTCLCLPSQAEATCQYSDT